MMPPMKAGRLTVRLADPLDVQDLVPRLRPWDLVECLALGRAPATALMDPFVAGHGPTTFALEQDGKLIALAGLTPLLIGSGIWMLGSEEIDDCGLDFLRLGREWVHWAAREHGPLQNVVPVQCTTTIRWLKWMGFDFDPSFMHFSGVRFVRFRMKATGRPEKRNGP